MLLPIAAGLVALLLCLFLLGSFLRADVRRLAGDLRLAGGVLLLLATVALVVMGRVGIAFLTGSIGWALLSGQSLRSLGGPFGRRPGGQAGGSSTGRDRPGRMSRAEALNVLGLKEGATEAEIRAAHRRLIQQTHPDRGGSNYLAAKINEAKDVLLGK